MEAACTQESVYLQEGDSCTLHAASLPQALHGNSKLAGALPQGGMPQD